LLESEKFELYDEKMSFKPGDKVGEFRIGSTIVLVSKYPLSHLSPSTIFCLIVADI
jgi:hypothetical protein